MEYKDMDAAQLEERRAALIAIDAEAATLEELLSAADELRGINAELEARKTAEAERRAAAAAIVEGAGEIVTAAPEIRTTKENKMEIRNTAEYIDAFAKFVRTGDDRECRSLLTENVTGGTVAVPEFVYEIVKNAWESNELVRRIRKTYVAGNLKVNFEISSSDATKHTEGAAAVTEEDLVLGIVNLIPANYKKWIGVSDEVVDMGGEAFLRYVYDELAYRIVKAVADDLVLQIMTQAASPDATKPAVPTANATSALDVVLAGLAELSEEAAGSAVVILNRTTWSAIEAEKLSANYAVDPFYGLPVIFSSKLLDKAVIVGSLERGALLNLPNGLDVKINFDDKTLATQDMNRVIGRLYAAVGVIAPDAFALSGYTD